MTNITKIDISRQSKLDELTLSEINDIIDEGETVLYKKENGNLGMATKNIGVVEDIDVSGNVIKNLTIPDLPPTDDFPEEMEGYALCAVRDGFNFKLVWALVDTKINYNVL
jgi:hypothetical protein